MISDIDAILDATWTAEKVDDADYRPGLIKCGNKTNTISGFDASLLFNNTAAAAT